MTMTGYIESQILYFYWLFFLSRPRFEDNTTSFGLVFFRNVDSCFLDGMTLSC